MGNITHCNSFQYLTTCINLNVVISPAREQQVAGIVGTFSWLLNLAPWLAFNVSTRPVCRQLNASSNITRRSNFTSTMAASLDHVTVCVGRVSILYTQFVTSYARVRMCWGPRESIYIDTNSIVGCESAIKCIMIVFTFHAGVKIRTHTNCDVLFVA